MFYQDFSVGQGVLNVDTTSLGTSHVPASSFSTSAKVDFFPAIYAADLPHQPQPNYSPMIAIAENQIFTTQVVSSGDVDFPKPPK